MTEQFADLSHHNGAVDLAAYAKAGHARVALKATDGRAFNDPAFPARWAAARAARLARVAYHYAQTETSGAQEADHILGILDQVGGLGAGDVLALDVEDDDSAFAVGRADAFAGEFCRRMVARGHPGGLLYTGRWYADPAGITPGDVPAGWRRLWLSDYSTAADAAMLLPTGWDRAHVAARQYTNSATVPGIAGRSDYSRVLNDWLEDDMAITDEDIAALNAAAQAGKLDHLAIRCRDFVRDTAGLAKASQIAALADPATLAAELAPLILAGLPANIAGVTAEQITGAVVAGLHQVAEATADATESAP